MQNKYIHTLAPSAVILFSVVRLVSKRCCANPALWTALATATLALLLALLTGELCNKLIIFGCASCFCWAAAAACRFAFSRINPLVQSGNAAATTKALPAASNGCADNSNLMAKSLISCSSLAICRVFCVCARDAYKSDCCRQIKKIQILFASEIVCPFE